MFINNDYIIRLETKKDYIQVEKLVYKTFQQIHPNKCYEHFIVHTLRNCSSFIKELDFVLEKNNVIIGHNIFIRSTIYTDINTIVPILVMGPISIASNFQNQGYGTQLLNYSLQQASLLGYGAVFLEGDINFYKKSNFNYAKDFGIRYNNLTNIDSSYFLCKELIHGYLNNITGIYKVPLEYQIKELDFQNYNKKFFKNI